MCNLIRLKSDSNLTTFDSTVLWLDSKNFWWIWLKGFWLDPWLDKMSRSEYCLGESISESKFKICWFNRKQVRVGQTYAFLSPCFSVFMYLAWIDFVSSGLWRLFKCLDSHHEWNHCTWSKIFHFCRVRVELSFWLESHNPVAKFCAVSFFWVLLFWYLIVRTFSWQVCYFTFLGSVDNQTSYLYFMFKCHICVNATATFLRYFCVCFW